MACIARHGAGMAWHGVGINMARCMMAAAAAASVGKTLTSSVATYAAVE